MIDTRAIDTLVQARDLIADPDRWIQFYREKGVFHKRYCAVGAIERAAPTFKIATRAERLLVQAIGEPITWPRASIQFFNDRVETTHEDVLQAFDRAIEAASNPPKKMLPCAVPVRASIPRRPTCPEEPECVGNIH